MSLPYDDPSNPALPSPLFSDLTAVRGDHLRANNNAIFTDLSYLDDLIAAYWLRTIYGDNAYGSVLSTDLNAITKSGFYTCLGSATGVPSASYSWFVLHQNSALGIASEYQRAVAFSTSIIIYERTKISSMWGSWELSGDHSSPKIEGLILSNNLSDLTNDLDISAGSCNNSTRTSTMKLLSALTKRLDATWAAGNNAGLLQAGQTKANSKSYRLYLIASADSLTVDVIATEYNIALVLPTGYTKYRYIGSIRTLSTGAIQRFEHIGNEFMTLTDTLAVNASYGTGTTNIAIANIPLGLTRPLIRVEATHLLGETIVQSILPDGVASSALLMSSSSAGTDYMQGYGTVILNAAYEIRLVTTSTTTRQIFIKSFVDRDREAF